MPRSAFQLLLVSLTAACTGCAMCASPYDYAYNHYGGRIERKDMCHGRVGSIIAPPKEVAVVPYEGAPTPTPAEPPEAPSPAFESLEDAIREETTSPYYESPGNDY